MSSSWHFSCAHEFSWRLRNSVRKIAVSCFLGARPGSLAAWMFLSLAVISTGICPPMICSAQQDGDETRRGSDDNNEFGLVATTIQLPTLGVAVDADGLLTAKMVTDPRGERIRQRLIEAQREFPQALAGRARLRMVSLKRLEAELAKHLQQGDVPPDELLKVAGLVRANFLFVLPEHDDIVIAGPAEPWVENLAGRTVGVHSNLPTLLLQDIAAALRAYHRIEQAGDQQDGVGQQQQADWLKKWVAVSIDPTADGLERLAEFQRTIPKRVAENARPAVAARMVAGLQESLGNAKIRVYGIERTTHLAQVLIESDYRMKMIGIGLEPAPQGVLTFIEELTGAPRNMQRWWLMPNYECVIQADDELSVQLVGQGVQLSTADIVFDENARIVHTGLKPGRAAVRYAETFTRKYDALSKSKPVFAQLRNAIDLLVLSAWLNKTEAFAQLDWRPEVLLDEEQFAINTLATPKETPHLANAVWKEHVLIAPCGGGVSIQAGLALEKSNLLDPRTAELDQWAGKLRYPADPTIWWWDP